MIRTPSVSRPLHVLTGVTVVSSHPQSTTRPVMRPHDPRASTLDGVNATEGTYSQLRGATTYSQILKERSRNLLFDEYGKKSVLQYEHFTRFTISEKMPVISEEKHMNSLVIHVSHLAVNPSCDQAPRFDPTPPRSSDSTQVKVPHLSRAGTSLAVLDLRSSPKRRSWIRFA